MTLDFQSWMRAVSLSLIEPADIARDALKRRHPSQVLWQAITLIAVLHVLLFAAGQALAPRPAELAENAIQISPFGMAGLFGISLYLMVYTLYYAGHALDGEGSLHDTLTLLTWFHAVSLTLEVIQVLLLIISPYLAAMFSLIAFGGLLWCILNFINVLHGFQSLGKSFVTLVMSLIGIAILGGLILMMVVSLFGGAL